MCRWKLTEFGHFKVKKIQSITYHHRQMNTLCEACSCEDTSWGTTMMQTWVVLKYLNKWKNLWWKKISSWWIPIVWLLISHHIHNHHRKVTVILQKTGIKVCCNIDVSQKMNTDWSNHKVFPLVMHHVHVFQVLNQKTNNVATPARETAEDRL